MGIFILQSYRQYRQVCILLLLVIISAIFNLLEELNITRELYLVTPIFILGFGPAIYLAIAEILGDKIDWSSAWHYFPMILALPFTSNPEIVIAVGTLWRLIYAALSLNKMFVFHKNIVKQRSDSDELSMNWMVWSLSIMTFVNMLNLIRLNIQPIISHTANLIGQGISTSISLFFIGLLIYQLLHKKESFSSLLNEQEAEKSKGVIEKGISQENDKVSSNDTEHFQQIFEYLSNEISSKKWYKIPRLTLNNLSELSGLQARDISRAINIGSQMNFNDYINQLRLVDVIQQIEKGGEEPFLNLALEAGFNSKSTFNQAFKRQYLMTPLEYRNTLAI
jgi:AraC-like DNA-binding protein